MTKFVKCIDNKDHEDYLTKGKIYEVIKENNHYCCYIINDDTNAKTFFYTTRFEEVKQQEETTNKFCFIPKTEITEVIVDGIEGILIKE